MGKPIIVKYDGGIQAVDAAIEQAKREHPDNLGSIIVIPTSLSVEFNEENNPWRLRSLNSKAMHFR